MKHAITALVITSWLCGAAQAQTAQPRHMMHGLFLASRTLQAGDTAQALTLLQAAETFGPADTRVLYELARAYAWTGKTTAALQALQRLAAAGGSANIDAEVAFTTLRAEPRFGAAAAAVRVAAAPLIRSDTLRVVPVTDFVPEGLAYDPAEKMFYLGSIASQQIIRFDQTGRPTRFAKAPGEVLGLRVDVTRRRLWAAVRIPDPRAPRGVTGSSGWAALLGFNLGDGREVVNLQLSDTARAHLLNDLALGADGSVYVTDSEGGTVYRLRDDATLQPLIADDQLVYPNGLALSADERHLFVAHVEGILRIDLQSGVAVAVAAPTGQSIGFIDGLYRHGNALLGIQGLRDFHRLVRLELSAEAPRIVGVQVLEQRHPAHRTPTTGVLVGDEFVYIANSELDRLRPDGSLTAGAGSPVLLLRLTLRRTARQ